MHRSDKNRRLTEGYTEGASGHRSPMDFDDLDFSGFGGGHQFTGSDSRARNRVRDRHHNFDEFGYGTSMRGWYKNLDNQEDYRRANNFGRGPKGYHRSSERIRDDVCEALYNAPDVDASEIEVDVQEGIVTLTGTVNSKKEKRAVERYVDGILGVEDVMNMLKPQGDLKEGQQLPGPAL